MASDWYPQKDYCTKCQSWSNGQVIHEDRTGTVCGGNKWVNIVTGMTYCEKCKKQWPAEDCVYYCNCGNVQKMIYTDSAVVIEVGDQVIYTVGNMVYVRRRSGAVVVGQRQVHTVSYVR